VCGNHIVWNAEEVTEVKMVHRGRINERFGSEMAVRMRKFANDGTILEERMIEQAKAFEIAPNREGLVKALFGNKALGLSKRAIEASYEAAQQWEHTAKAAPTTAWGFVHGLTRYSQTLGFTGDRHHLDVAGGKVLALAA